MKKNLFKTWFTQIARLCTKYKRALFTPTFLQRCLNQGFPYFLPAAAPGCLSQNRSVCEVGRLLRSQLVGYVTAVRPSPALASHSGARSVFTTLTPDSTGMPLEADLLFFFFFSFPGGEEISPASLWSPVHSPCPRPAQDHPPTPCKRVQEGKGKKG